MRAVTYARVSTERQGRSGLGLEAQKHDLEVWLAAHPDATVIGRFVEVESGTHNDRPQLHAALDLCALTGATLVVAKLDRLSRNAAFLLTLRDSGVRLVALDCADVQNPVILAVMASMAQRERELISERTRKALAAKREALATEGKRLGNPNGAAALRKHNGSAQASAARIAKADDFAQKMSAILRPMKAEGLSLRQMAARLMEMGVLTQRGGATWTASGVRAVLARIEG